MPTRRSGNGAHKPKSAAKAKPKRLAKATKAQLRAMGRFIRELRDLLLGHPVEALEAVA